jgi:ABC-type antimicrobial peptide transport system permease subunit
VLAFSVSARTREFGVRLAIGSTPMHLLVRVLREGAAIGVGGIVAGVAGGLLLSWIVGSFVPDVQVPGLAPIAGAALVLVLAAIVASVTPAARASRVDVVRALRAE